MSAAFIKIGQATGLYDHWLDAQGTPPIDEEQWAQHAVQSVVWDAIGVTRFITTFGATQRPLDIPGQVVANLPLLKSPSYWSLPNRVQRTTTESLCISIEHIGLV